MRWLIPGIACHLVLGCCLIWAQEPTATAPAAAQTPPGDPGRRRHAARQSPRPRPRPSESRRSSRRSTTSRASDGKLVPLLGFTFDDFIKVFNQMQGLLTEARPSRYVLEKLSVVGRIEADRAELTVQWDVVSREDGLVRVPLHFPQAVVQGDVRHEGEGRNVSRIRRGRRRLRLLDSRQSRPTPPTHAQAAPAIGDGGRRNPALRSARPTRPSRR